MAIVTQKCLRSDLRPYNFKPFQERGGREDRTCSQTSLATECLCMQGPFSPPTLKCLPPPLCGQTLGWVWLCKPPAARHGYENVQGVVTPISTILIAVTGSQFVLPKFDPVTIVYEVDSALLCDPYDSHDKAFVTL